jgi:hypothetical protein
MSIVRKRKMSLESEEGQEDDDDDDDLSTTKINKTSHPEEYPNEDDTALFWKPIDKTEPILSFVCKCQVCRHPHSPTYSPTICPPSPTINPTPYPTINPTPSPTNCPPSPAYSVDTCPPSPATCIDTPESVVTAIIGVQ